MQRGSSAAAGTRRATDRLGRGRAGQAGAGDDRVVPPTAPFQSTQSGPDLGGRDAAANIRLGGSRVVTGLRSLVPTCAGPQAAGHAIEEAWTMGATRREWPRWWARPVIEGSVDCELRGTVDIEECQGCTWLLQADGEGPEATEVRCRPDAGRLAARGMGI